MLKLPSEMRVWVGAAPIDMRKGCLSLATMITSELKQDLKSGQLFVFFGKDARKVKIVYWDRNGFAMWYKTLAEGRYRLPRIAKASYSMTLSDLTLLLEGIDLISAQRLRMV